MQGKNRTKDKGSFGGHFEEIVKHFPHEPRGKRSRPEPSPRERQEKRDIHALLFEQAWKLEGSDNRDRG